MDLRQYFKSRTDGTNFLSLDDSSTLCAYSFSQIGASDEWIINHNNDSIILAVQVFVNDEMVMPDEIIIDNSNTFRVLFTIAVEGIVNFLIFKTGSADCAELTPTPTVTPSPSVGVSPTPAITPSPTVSPTLTPTPTATEVGA